MIKKLKLYKIKMEKNKIINKRLISGLLCVLSFLIMLISFTSSFGISSHYWNDNPLKLAPGESALVDFGLQNMVGGEDVTLDASLSSDEGIKVELSDGNSVYPVPFGTKDKKILLNISVPEGAEVGKVHEVALSLKQISTEEGGMLRVTGEVTSTIPVQIVEPKDSAKRIEEQKADEEAAKNSAASKNNLLIYLFPAIAIVAVLIIFLIVRKKNLKNVGKKNIGSRKKQTNKF